MHEPWLVLIRDQLLAARAPAGGGMLMQSHHTRSPAVGRQVGSGGWLGRVSPVCALTLRWWEDCYLARVRRLPSRRLLPPTRPSHPSLCLEPFS